MNARNDAGKTPLSMVAPNTGDRSVEESGIHRVIRGSQLAARIGWRAPCAMPRSPGDVHPRLAHMGDMHACDEERAAILSLLDERPALGDEQQGKTAWSTIASEVAQRGSAVALWDESHPLTLDGMYDANGALARAHAQLDEWRESDFDLITVLDSECPLALRGIHQLPPVLFVKGNLLADEVSVSVVGSRKSTRRGCGVASNVAKGLVERGISVIS